MRSLTIVIPAGQNNLSSVVGPYKTFRGVFKKITGLTPVDYRNRFNKDALVQMN